MNCNLKGIVILSEAKDLCITSMIALHISFAVYMSEVEWAQDGGVLGYTNTKNA